MMSLVDNCILSFSICEDDEKIIEVNSFFNVELQKPFVDVDANFLPTGWYGGSKMLETPLFIAAFNYFPESEFINHLKTLNWKYPEDVQLIIKRQDDSIFSIINVSKIWGE